MNGGSRAVGPTAESALRPDRRIRSSAYAIVAVAVALVGLSACIATQDSAAPGAGAEERPVADVDCAPDSVTGSIYDGFKGGESSPEEALRVLENRAPALGPETLRPLDDEGDVAYYELKREGRRVALVGVTRHDDGTYAVGSLEVCSSLLHEQS